MTCIVKQWVLQDFVILCIVLHIESTNELQQTKKISNCIIKNMQSDLSKNNTLPTLVWPRNAELRASIDPNNILFSEKIFANWSIVIDASVGELATFLSAIVTANWALWYFANFEL